MEMRLSQDDHARVTEAVARAEQATDGEIVTIVAGRSDDYDDVALAWAVAAMLGVVGIVLAIPGALDGINVLLTNGWTDESDLRPLIVALLAVQTVVFLIARQIFGLPGIRMALTPGAVRTRNVRKRAVEYFRSSAEKRTHGRIGILLYVSLDEHRAELIGDEAITAKIAAEQWGDAMAALVERMKAGDPAGGMAAAVDAIGAILAQHFPKTHEDTNELPDRLIEL